MDPTSSGSSETARRTAMSGSGGALGDVELGRVRVGGTGTATGTGTQAGTDTDSLRLTDSPPRTASTAAGGESWGGLPAPACPPVRTASTLGHVWGRHEPYESCVGEALVI